MPSVPEKAVPQHDATATPSPPQPSTTTTTTTADHSPPPDGGLAAWQQVLAGHLTVFNSFGQINSFGIYQSYYAARLRGLSPSTISWIGSLQILLIYGVGALSGRALDAGHFRAVVGAGQALQVVGMFALSGAMGDQGSADGGGGGGSGGGGGGGGGGDGGGGGNSYWKIVLAQGVCQGLGMGLAFCPAVANAATYFARRRVVAISLVACGGATGGMVFPAIAQRLLVRVGFAWTVRVMGFVVLFNAAVILVLGRTRGQGKREGPRAPLIEWSAFTEMPYLLYCVSMFFAFWGIWVAYYYVRAYARDILNFSDTDSFNLILIINGVGVPGRLVPALIADRFFGPVNVFIPVILLAGICLFCWAAVSSSAGMIVFVVFYGFFGAGTQSLLQAALASLNTDIKKAGVRIGMGFSVVGLASLTGSPIGGALLEQKDGQYLYAQIFAGGTMVLGSLVLVAARISKTGLVIRARM